MSDFFDAFWQGLLQTSALEYIGVTAGIVSVWFSRKEHILVFPTGLVNTTIFIYLSAKAHLYGEASVNAYYTIMSLYGWWLWSRKNQQTQAQLVQIRFSTPAEWAQQIVFFLGFYVGLYLALDFLQESFSPEAIPWADAFAAATAYTGMWLMARKKVESWYWWMATNLASIPLYYAKGFVFTSFQFLVLLIMAIAGWASWHKKAKHAPAL